MKKFIFGLIATVMFGFVGNAQSNQQIKEIFTKNRPVFAKYMVEFVNSLKPSYDRSDTYDSFASKVSDPKVLPSDGQILLKKAFIYIKENKTDQYIQDNENGYELALVLNNAYKVKDTTSIEDYLFGKTAGPKRGFWGSIWHAVSSAAEWVWDNAGEIIDIYVKCCQAHLCCG